MKIAFVVSEFPTLSETFILNQITGLVERGHDIRIIAQRRGKADKVHDDVEKYNLKENVIYHAMPRSKLVRALSALLFLFRKPSLIKTMNVFKYGVETLNLEALFVSNALSKESEFDVIYCHFGTLGNLGAIVRDSGFMKGRVITTFHGNDISAFLKKRGERAYEFLFENGDLFLPISENWRKRLVSLGCDKKKITVHRMGIETEKFAFRIREPEMDGIVKLTTIARLVEKKGVEYGIRAVARALKTNPNIEYQIVGDGPLRKSLEVLIEELGVGEQVTLLGWLDQAEVVRILEDTHLFLAPSVTASDGDQEGIPVVLMEALSMGIPVISTEHSGIPELVEDGTSGHLVRERDVDALTDKITLLARNTKDWERLGRNGRRHVEEHYDVARLNERLESIFLYSVKGMGDYEYFNYQRALVKEQG
ncbi:glycosyltransferase [Paenibacillus sp. TRM 82003]|nr:glycosyltransferase [Paenibacillus sp. TRM 82003]